MAAPGFWDDRARAQAESKRLAELKSEIEDIETVQRELSEASELANLDAADPGHPLNNELAKKANELEKHLRTLELATLLDGAYDEKSAIITVHAGSGGTEAMDWAGMLLRMLLRYAERKEWSTRIVDESRGEVAGYKHVTIAVEGRWAYGWLKSEAGVHRLVRISPFDAEQMRHTSFALVEVLPELDEVAEVEIKPEDIRLDTFLSSGHGGQSVQTTYSAVRIVHEPSGIVVTCQNERSQLQNRETAMKILRGKLLARRLAEQEQERTRLRGVVLSPEWGNQIRSYVLQPYKMVKDHRSKFETNDPDRVLDGDLDELAESYLRWEHFAENRE
jgi:peptide chain release factor 2